jgi:hypothetical protein
MDFVSKKIEEKTKVEGKGWWSTWLEAIWGCGWRCCSHWSEIYPGQVD